MSKKPKLIWIEKGYEHFALYGPENLSINKLSREIGSSRASFYHHFGDMDVFIEELLDMHWQICQQFTSIGAKKCKRLFPDLYKLLEQYPIPLQFHKQLFLNRHNPAYNYLFIKIYNDHANAFILKLFSEQFGLRQTKENLNNLWLTVGEAWYSRLDTNDMSAEKMQLLAADIMRTVLKFVSSDFYSKIQEKTLKE